MLEQLITVCKVLLTRTFAGYARQIQRLKRAVAELNESTHFPANFINTAPESAGGSDRIEASTQPGFPDGRKHATKHFTQSTAMQENITRRNLHFAFNTSPRLLVLGRDQALYPQSRGSPPIGPQGKAHHLLSHGARDLAHNDAWPAVARRQAVTNGPTPRAARTD